MKTWEHRIKIQEKIPAVAERRILPAFAFASTEKTASVPWTVKA